MPERETSLDNNDSDDTPIESRNTESPTDSNTGADTPEESNLENLFEWNIGSENPMGVDKCSLENLVDLEIDTSSSDSVLRENSAENTVPASKDGATVGEFSIS